MGAAPPGLPAVAMVLAAGRGVRMRHLTAERPKPLVEVGGRTLIDRVLDHLAAAGVGRAVVNVHHMAEMLEAHLEARPGQPQTLVSDERGALLETGGGVRKALPLLGQGPFLAINSDALWTDGAATEPESTLHRLAAQWRGEAMDALLLMVPTAEVSGYGGRGDFLMDDQGSGAGPLIRRPSEGQAPYLYGGIQILHPRLFEGTRDGAFSLNRLYDKAAAAGRLFGVAHRGRWFHVGSPEGFEAAERGLAEIAAAGGSP